MRRGHYTLLLLGLALLCIGIALFSGAYRLSMGQILHLLLQQGDPSPTLSAEIVLWRIRLPRIAAALLIGAALAGAGCVYQGMFRNPLVSPDILGVAAGAGLGACAAILLGMPMILIQLCSFAGGLAVISTVLIIARYAQRLDPVLTLVLIGIALGTLCGAGISLIKTLADPYTQLPSITFWLLGSLATISATDLALMAPLILLGCVPMLLLRWRINLLTLSDDEANSLGVNVKRLRLILIVSATLVTAAAVSVAGIIGWIGLVIPHIGRLLVGDNHQSLLPLSIALGALLLLTTDTLARTLSSSEIPLGILTAFIGAPFFLALLLRGRRP
ncbi:FecCD family ABC transporter permease [Edwardsiella tarda]|uniref:FecCD family ABC transporter permease n=1 Tax=Edwardsiella tarda TaxID=636 RepID=UPI0034DDBDDB